MKGELMGAGPQPLRRPALVRPDPPAQSQQTVVQVVPPGSIAASGSGPKLTTSDALDYLKSVKEIFQDQKGKYDEFLEVMKDFKSQRINTEGVIMRVKELFKGNRDLILGFNNFLPKGYEIRMDEKKPVEFDEAINFVNKIKNRFQHEEHVYKSFLDILNMYRKENKTIQDVYREVEMLFEHHPDLLEEFTHFLPDNSSVTPQPLPPTRIIRRDDRSSIIPKKERAYGSAMDREHSVDRPDPDHERKRRLEKERESRKEESRARREQREREERETEQDAADSTAARKKIRQTEERATHVPPPSDAVVEASNNAGNIVGGNLFAGASGTSIDDKNALRNQYPQEFSFCERVKEKLHPGTYQEFIKCLHIYSQEIINRTELENLVGDLLQSYQELKSGFTEFLNHCENIDEFITGLNKRQMPRPPKQEEREREQQQLPQKEEREKEHHHHHRERAERVEREREKEKESDAKGVNVISSKEAGSTSQSTHKASGSKEKYNLCKPISELDFSNSPRCTPSYRLLPKSYPMPPASNRTQLGVTVLNDLWVSVTSGSEDYSFKHMRKNQYEESLFRCEDDRFELDMLLESVNATTKRVEELLDKLHDSSVKSESPIRIEEFLTPLNFRCIERLYGDHGLDVMDVLRKNASLALPVILTRLKQKEEEWSRCRSDFNKVWAEIYSKNYHKSLDHRSFYFKQQDTKNLSTKALLGEVKEINEKQRKDADLLAAISAGNTRPLQPDMEFPYPDMEIHNDLYKIIKYSCGEVCTSVDQSDKIMRMWTDFLEPMLGVQSKALGFGGEESKEEGKGSKGRGGKSVILGEGSNNNGAGAMVIDGNPKGNDGNPKGNDGNGNHGGNARGNVEVAPGVVGTPSKSGHGTVDRASEPPRPTNEVLPHLERGDTSKSPTTKLTPPPPAPTSKIEREEGELSPNADFDAEADDNFISFQSSNPTPPSKPKPSNPQPNPDEESAHEDTGSENDQEPSGSESGEAEECSREEGEEEEEEGGGESEGMNNGAEEKDGNGSVERWVRGVRPVTKRVPMEEKGSRVFYGNDSFCVLFRLHQIFYERILSAKTNSGLAEKKWKMSKDTNPPDFYAKFLSALYGVLDGTADNTRFEDDCRAIIGTQSYVLFTLDKLIYKLVKQLQAMVSDEMDNKLLQLHSYEKSRSPSKFSDFVYYENARVLVHEDSIYRFECSSNPSKLFIQLMEGVDRPEVTAVSIDPNFSSYLHKDFLSSECNRKGIDTVFLPRNKRKIWGDDEIQAAAKAFDGVKVYNGLEYKLSCTSSKISYVLDTEDFLCRTKKKRRVTAANGVSIAGGQTVDQARISRRDQAKVERFHRFLASRSS